MNAMLVMSRNKEGHCAFRDCDKTPVDEAVTVSGTLGQEYGDQSYSGEVQVCAEHRKLLMDDATRGLSLSGERSPEWLSPEG